MIMKERNVIITKDFSDQRYLEKLKNESEESRDSYKISKA